MIIFYSYIAVVVIGGAVIAWKLFWSKANKPKVEHEEVLVLRERKKDVAS